MELIEIIDEVGEIMVKLTQSLKKYLENYHSDIIIPLTFGHTELLTQEIWGEYIDWCRTDEGRQYLKGGSKYNEVYSKSIGVD